MTVTVRMYKTLGHQWFGPATQHNIRKVRVLRVHSCRNAEKGRYRVFSPVSECSAHVGDLDR